MAARRPYRLLTPEKYWSGSLDKLFPESDALAVQMFRLWLFREDVKAMLRFMRIASDDKVMGSRAWAQRSMLFRHIAVALYEGLRILAPGEDDADGQHSHAYIKQMLEEAKMQPHDWFHRNADNAEKPLPALVTARDRLRSMRNQVGGAHLDSRAVRKVLARHYDYIVKLALSDNVAATQCDTPSEVAMMSLLPEKPKRFGDVEKGFKAFIEPFYDAHNAFLLSVDALMWLYAARRGLVTGRHWRQVDVALELPDNDDAKAVRITLSSLADHLFRHNFDDACAGCLADVTTIVPGRAKPLSGVDAYRDWLANDFLVRHVPKTPCRFDGVRVMPHASIATVMGTWKVRFTNASGVEDASLNFTMVLHRQRKQWLIAHQHLS